MLAVYRAYLVGMKAYHGTSTKAAEHIRKHGFSLRSAGARQAALRGEEIAELPGVYLTPDRRTADWYAGETFQPGLHRGGVVIEVTVQGRIAPSKELWTVRRQVDDSLGQYNMWDQKERARRAAIVLQRLKDRGYAGIYENNDEFIVFDPKHVKVIRMFRADSQDVLAKRLAVAAIPGGLKAKIEKLKPNDKLKVWHGTSLQYAFELVNGFDANKVQHRHYGGPRHAGVFVSPDPELAARFAHYGEIVLEIETKARNLHGVDYSGNIGREQDMEESTREWISSKYPKSFRPYLSMTMLQANEPQGLLRGLVRPSQIKRVRYKAYGKEAVWYSRKAFLALGLETIPARDAPYGAKQKLADLGFDVSSPNYTLDQLAQVGSGLIGVTPERFISALERRAKRDGEDGVFKMLEQAGFGETAARKYARMFAKKASITAMLWAGRADLANAIAYAQTVASADMIVRVWEGTTNEAYAWLNKLGKSGHVYRGMAHDEYKATVGKGKPVFSTGRYSLPIEGTCFSDDPMDAESYANFGRDDPRKTGKPTYLVEVKKTPTMYQDTDHYIKSHEPVDTVTRVWQFYVVPHDDGVNGKALAVKKLKG